MPSSGEFVVVNQAAGEQPLAIGRQTGERSEYLTPEPEAQQANSAADGDHPGQSSVLHLVLEPNGFVPIEFNGQVRGEGNEEQEQVVDKQPSNGLPADMAMDSAKRGRRDSSLMCVDVLSQCDRPQSSQAPTATQELAIQGGASSHDFEQYFQPTEYTNQLQTTDYHHHFYEQQQQRNYLATQANSMGQYPESHVPVSANLVQNQQQQVDIENNYPTNQNQASSRYHQHNSSSWHQHHAHNSGHHHHQPAYNTDETTSQQYFSQLQQPQHTQLQSNVSRYDTGGQVIEYRPIAEHSISSCHQYGGLNVSTDYRPLVDNTAFVTDAYAGYFTQSTLESQTMRSNSHSNHQQHNYQQPYQTHNQHPNQGHIQYQMASHHQTSSHLTLASANAVNSVYLDSHEEDSGGAKTYHVLGQDELPKTTAPTTSKEQQVQEVPLYQETGGLESLDSQYESLDPNADYYVADYYHHNQQQQPQQPSVPNVSGLYDPNTEISAVLMDSQSDEDEETSNEDSTEQNSVKGKQTQSSRSRSNATSKDTGPRCSPETIEKLRKFLLGRRRKLERGGCEDVGTGQEIPSSAKVFNNSLQSASTKSRYLTSRNSNGNETSKDSYSVGSSGDEEEEEEDDSGHEDLGGRCKKLARVAYETNNYSASSTMNLIDKFGVDRGAHQLSKTNFQCSKRPASSPKRSLNDSNSQNLTQRCTDTSGQNNGIDNNGDVEVENRQLRSRTIVISKRR